MKKVLVTGGAGFIGSNLCLKLLKIGYDVVVLDDLNKQIHGEDVNKSYTYNLIKDKVKFIKGNVKERKAWDLALTDDIDLVIHLAAETGTGQSMYEIEKYISTNIGGTSIMWDKIVNENLNVKKVIVASSRAIYGEGKFSCSEHGIVYPEARRDSDMQKGDFDVKCPICNKNVKMELTDEDSKSHPTSIYGYTKKAQEEISLLIGKAINLPVVAFRFQNVYGPGQSLKNPYTGILSIFSTQIRNKNNINIFEDGLETRDFVYIDDVTDAIILSIDNDKANYEVFNVGSGENINVLRIANTLKEKYNSTIDIVVSGNYRLGDIKDNQADLTKINKLLGYVPKVNFKTGISNFVDWVERQDIESDNYDKSIEEIKAKGLFK